MSIIGCATKATVEMSEGELTVLRDGRPLFAYQFEPMDDPKGGERFKGSNFIHPLYTPSGFCVTELQPEDHLHHFGLWWPWKMIEVDGRVINTWELQNGEGLVQARRAVSSEYGFAAESDYIDRTAPGGAQTVLKETANVKWTDFNAESAQGCYLDIEIIHRCAADKPVVVSNYRYSGFSLRAAPHWNRDNSTILTSEGKGRDEANFTRAAWIQVEGKVPAGGDAGVLMMGHPSNRSHPEYLRTWDSQHGGAVFINFNPVQEMAWKFEPGRDYVRRYRVFAYDGRITENQVDGLWKEYMNED